MQVRCTHRILGRFLDQVETAFGRDRAIILVHGDHGLRGTAVEPTAQGIKTFNPADFTAGFSTLLAIRYPGASGAVSRGPVPVQDFLWELIAGGFQRPPDRQWDNFVYSSTGRNPTVSVRRPLAPTEMLWSPADSQPAAPSSQ
jgi:hypothetical protein